MKAIYALILFSFMNLYAYSQYSQQPDDTTVTISAGARIEFTLRAMKIWAHIPDMGCIKFEYPTPFTIVVISTCAREQSVTLKRDAVNLDMDGEPLLDVPRPKKE